MIYTFTGENDSTWTCTPTTSEEMYRTLDPEEDHDQPYETLTWYKCEQDPCLDGDDVYVGWNDDVVCAMIFDGCVMMFDELGRGLEETLRLVCLDPDALDPEQNEEHETLPSVP